MFTSQLSRIINTNQSRSVILTGNVYDIFYDGENYVPLVDYLGAKYKIKPDGDKNGKTQLIYEVNSPIKVVGDFDELETIWNRFRGKQDAKYSLHDLCEKANGNPTLAFEFLRQLTMCSRRAYKREASHNDLLIIIEAADMLVPEENISTMNMADRKRVAILHDWFSDPDFIDGPDSVIMIAESSSLIHSRVTRLPQILSVEIESPGYDQRLEYLMVTKRTAAQESIARNTAGLSLHALRQLTCLKPVTPAAVVDKVGEYIVSQLGDTVEFLKPSHKFEDVVGFKRLKKFIKNEMMPRILASGDEALPGAAVGGPIGGGKSFMFLALASELGIPVLVLKNLRSMYYGQTDVKFERLKRVLTALDKVLIFVDEADTQFGGVGEGTHDTERRLTGKVQAMMSDPALRGRVVWLLMTARIHLLSPDIRRPGRVGDLIIPVLDPEDEDRTAFLHWVFGDFISEEATNLKGHQEAWERILDLTEGYSAAAFAGLKSRIKSKRCKTIEEAVDILQDMIPPDIGETRLYQTLQAKINCTRQSLLFDEPKSRTELDEIRKGWRDSISQLEAKGVR